ncbi:MAG: HIT family protein [Thermoleophilia bacterium]|nr:HIT family protein [Thermoleophilia bacterium]
MPAARIIAENGLAYAVRDAYPVSPLHTLVIPKRHVASYFSLYLPERRAVERLIDLIHGDILERDDAVMGFNVGINQGEVAGQSIFHCHVHVIPRRWGDDPKPRGGVRKAVRGEGDYPCRPA